MSYDELETERLRLRMWRESDLDDYAALTADPLVMQYLQPGKPPFTRADAWRSIAFFMGHWQMSEPTRGGASRFSWDTGR